MIAWFWLQQITEAGPALRLLLIVLPLLPAVVISASARAPFGDTELLTSRWLPAFRFGHLIGLLVCGAAILSLAAYNWAVADVGWELIRNLMGYSGLALLGAWVFGSSIAWIAPLAYATLTLMVDDTHRWAFPRRFPNDRWSVMIAVSLIVIGLLLVSLRGARENPGEAV
jgi:hypothetical protein